MFRSQAPRYSKCTLPQVAPSGGQRIAGCEGDQHWFQPFRRQPLAEVNASQDAKVIETGFSPSAGGPWRR